MFIMRVKLMNLHLTATITYCLSETGRERSVKSGGSGAYHRNVSGPIGPEEVRLFKVSPDGYISLVFNVMEFDKPQTFSTLLTHLRKRHRRLSSIKVLMEAEALAQEVFSRSG
jgi:hypothetical protein